MKRTEPTPHLEVDMGAIMDLLVRRGLDEGQAEQVAGRWVQAGFELPEEIEPLLEAGVTQPEEAAETRHGDRAAPMQRHEAETEPRDVARGSQGSRSAPGDELAAEPQQPNSPS